MKKSIVIAVFLGATAFLVGCVHPTDLDAISPAAKTPAGIR